MCALVKTAPPGIHEENECAESKPQAQIKCNNLGEK